MGSWSVRPLTVKIGTLTSATPVARLTGTSPNLPRDAAVGDVMVTRNDPVCARNTGARTDARPSRASATDQTERSRGSAPRREREHVGAFVMARRSAGDRRASSGPDHQTYSR